MKIWNQDIFRKNDIRGVYKKDFDLEFVKTLAFSFVHLCTKKLGRDTSQKLLLALGHDSRLSSPEIAKHLSKFLNQAGADVYFLGLVPSPVCFFSSYFMKKVKAGLMITASHNPPNFNGFKMILNKKPVCGRKILQLKKITHSSSFTPLPRQLRGKTIPFDINSPYIALHKQRLYATPFIDNKKKLQNSSPSFAPLKNIAIDCANGASGPLAKKLFKALNFPLNIHWLYTIPDGRFPNHPPDPSSEKNLRDLQKTLKIKNCEFGVAFDGDGDRLVIVGKSGKILEGDELMSIFISDILNQKPKNPTFVVDVKCGDWFFNFLKRQKVNFIIEKSGHSLIRQKTLKEKAIFGGELSGHFFFCDDFFPLDDGLYGLLRLIDICIRKKKTPEELVFKKTSVETPEIRKSISNMPQAKNRLKYLKKFYKTQKTAQLSFIDGVRASFLGQAWGLARISNTQNEWTFRFGGKNKKALEKIKKDFYRQLHIS